MLVEFTVGNYKSFKDRVTLSMVASNVMAKDKQLDENNVFGVGDELRLLTNAAIYGANASGKSNLIAAMRFMRRFVLGSSKDTQAAEAISVEPFRLSTETSRQPSFFEIVFILSGKRYRYGFEVNVERVISEWLYYVPRRRESRLFDRHMDSYHLSSDFGEGKAIREKTRSNALFLSVVAQFNGAIAGNVLTWFRDLKVISGLNDAGLRAYTVEQFDADKFGREILQFVKRLDVGIDDVQVEKSVVTRESLPSEMPEQLKDAILRLPNPQRVTIKTAHKKYDSEGAPTSTEVFDIDDQESEGTKKLFALAGPLMDILKNGKVLVVDELDARLHPLMTSEIVRLFNSREANPHHAQLIFATHDTNLLNNRIFRRDQIWFTEKDRRGATHIFSLVEFKVRNDASFGSDYIHGKYGAIPFIGDLKRLLGEADA